MSPEIDPELLATVHAAVAPVVRAALVHGPLPSLYSPEYLTAPDVVKLAVLAVGGSAWVFARETVDSWLDEDYSGPYHRQNLLPAVTELQRLRYPPTGDRELWIRHGPAGPPALGIAA